MCILIWIKLRSAVSPSFLKHTERLHSANLFVYGSYGVLIHRSLSYPAPDKSAF